MLISICLCTYVILGSWPIGWGFLVIERNMVALSEWTIWRLISKVVDVRERYVWTDRRSWNGNAIDK